MSRPETKTKIKPNEQLAEPSMFRVIYINDDHTSIEFVIDSLVNHFGHDVATAEKITVDIHEAGSAVVAILPYEVAEQKGIEVTVSARSAGFPLQIKLEPDNS
jgi:ATP-dependent Clp protease adaptor protein ClpS